MSDILNYFAVISVLFEMTEVCLMSSIAFVILWNCEMLDLVGQHFLACSWLKPSVLVAVIFKRIIIFIFLVELFHLKSKVIDLLWFLLSSLLILLFKDAPWSVRGSEVCGLLKLDLRGIFTLKSWGLCKEALGSCLSVGQEEERKTKDGGWGFRERLTPGHKIAVSCEMCCS